MWGFANFPPLRVFLNDKQICKSEENNWQQGTVHGVHSLPGSIPTLLVLLDSGVQLARVPFFWCTLRPSVELLPPNESCYWDCLSRGIECVTYEHIAGIQTSVKLRSGKVVTGRYYTTLEWWGSTYADGVGALGSKQGHIILLDSGHIVCMPNNRISWHEPAAVTPFDWCGRVPNIRLLDKQYSCEKNVEGDNETYLY